MDHFCLLVEGFDATALKAGFARKGIKADVYPGRPGMSGSDALLYVRDPEGNTIELRDADQPRRYHGMILPSKVTSRPRTAGSRAALSNALSDSPVQPESCGRT